MILFDLESNSPFAFPCRVYFGPESLVDDLRHIPGTAILFYGFFNDFSVDFIVKVDRGFDHEC